MKIQKRLAALPLTALVPPAIHAQETPPDVAAAGRGFYWRNEVQWPIGQTGQSLYAGIDYGHVFGPGTEVLAGTQLAGAVIGIRGALPIPIGTLSWDRFAGTPICKPDGFDTARVTLGFQVTGQF